MNEKYCECYELPEQGVFIVGNQYLWQYIIDGIAVADENGTEVLFDAIKWLWYFRRM
ncbi:MAG: hypothetical protein K2P42_13385 [Lachnospiraceae bacterium]|nr:hypothetical protein [Lachnospiraceae bacterium]MDE7000825.1 hypothetical protein [Lachnospiraceae bacterium]